MARGSAQGRAAERVWMAVSKPARANGSIAAMNVLNAAPDGYTLLATANPDLVVAPLTLASAKYASDSFKLIGSFGSTDMVLVSHPDRPFNNLGALLKQMQRPGAKELSIAHWGQGTLAHCGRPISGARRCQVAGGSVQRHHSPSPRPWAAAKSTSHLLLSRDRSWE